MSACTATISNLISMGAEIIPFQRDGGSDALPLPQLRIFPTGAKKTNLHTLSREFAMNNGGYNMWTIPETLVKQVQFSDIILFSPRDKAYFDKIATVGAVFRISDEMYRSVWQPYSSVGDGVPKVRAYVMILTQMRDITWTKAPILRELGLHHIQGPNMMNKYIKRSMGTNDCTIRYYLENNMGDIERAYNAYASLFLNASMVLWNSSTAVEYPYGLPSFGSARNGFTQPYQPNDTVEEDDGIDGASVMSDETYTSDGMESSYYDDDTITSSGSISGDDDIDAN